MCFVNSPSEIKEAREAAKQKAKNKRATRSEGGRKTESAKQAIRTRRQLIY
jgi:hypothetical protein